MAWEDGMKVDPVAYTSIGVYTETYGVGEEANIANLYASHGFLEDAPNIAISIAAIMDYYIKLRS